MFIGFHHSDFPIYTPGTARAANRTYFKQCGTLQPGVNKAILGRIHANQMEQASYFVVRRSHREPHTIMQMQTRHMGLRGYVRAPRTAYHCVRSDYAIVRQAWKDGAVEELSAHETTQQARWAFKKLTGVPPHSRQSNIADA